ncbi:unnamed protein product [Camellia sinensis]
MEPMEMEIQLTFRRPLQSTPLFIDQEMQAALLGNRPNIHRRSEIMGNPLDMTEMMIVREMEKRRIREEILTAEQLLRWRELEGEVVREIMMEREIFMQQGSQGLPLAADSLLRRPDGQGVLLLGQRHGFGIGERPVTGLSWQEGRSDGTLSMVRQEGGGALGGSLFQCQLEAAMATHGIAIKPTYDLSNGQVLPMAVNQEFEGGFCFCRRIRALFSFLLMTPLKFPKGVARGKIIEQQLLFHQQCDHTCYCLKAKAFCRIA